MKIKQSDFNKLLNEHFSKIKSILIYGPDRGQVLEYGKNIISNLIVDKTNAMFTEFNYSADEIDEDPNILFNELSSISFLMSRKIITIKNATDKLAGIIKKSFDYFSSDDCLLIVLSDDLGTSSKIRNIFEVNDQELLSLPCYLDDGNTLINLIKNILNRYGILKIDNDAMQFLQSNLGSNREMTRSELDKLSLYMQGKDHLTYDDVFKVISDSSALQTSDLTYAIFSGYSKQALKLYPKVLDIGETPIVLIRVFLIYVKKLLSIHSSIQNGYSVNDALRINAIRYYKIIPIVQKHIQLWNINKLLHVMQILMDTDIVCKLKESPAEILVSDMILKICQYAAT